MGLGFFCRQKLCEQNNSICLLSTQRREEREFFKTFFSFFLDNEKTALNNYIRWATFYCSSSRLIEKKFALGWISSFGYFSCAA